MKQVLFGLITALSVASSSFAAPATMRVDYYHTGNDKEEHFSLDRVVVEPLPWPGNVARPVDPTNRGKYFFEIVDDVGGKVIRNLDGTKNAGLNRVVWNLAPNPPPNQQGGGGFGGGRGGAPQAVEPGTYIVTLTGNGKTLTKPVTVLQDRWLGER